MPTTRARWYASVRDIAPAAWQALAGAGNPFVSHAFLAALEESGAVGGASGWQPHPLTLEDEHGALLAAAPVYLKHDSRGEFVFDWAWAEAWHRHGLPWYPKLVAAAPFSPVGAPKMLLDPGHDAGPLRRALVQAAVDEARARGLSSLHWLFVEADEADALAEAGHLLRRDCQFHWCNDGYAGFDDFLARFRSARRKEVRRERRRVAASGLVIRRHGGDEIDPALWRRLYGLLARTFMVRGHMPYLDAGCLILLGERLGGALQAFVAWDGDEPVACALCLHDGETLYGRYWGSSRPVPALHFELCYYRGIEYCIETGLKRFEPGTQGEHKLARGFEPVLTRSAHWVAEAALRPALEQWVQREAGMVARYADAAREHLPFRRDGQPA